jgi:hypothetical protein
LEFGRISVIRLTGLERSLNDDKSPLIDLLVCIVCKETMKIEKSNPDTAGSDIIQYRCMRCGGIERVRLIRRSREAAVSGHAPLVEPK